MFTNHICASYLFPMYSCHEQIEGTTRGSSPWNNIVSPLKGLFRQIYSLNSLSA